MPSTALGPEPGARATASGAVTGLLLLGVDPDVRAVAVSWGGMLGLSTMVTDAPWLKRGDAALARAAATSSSRASTSALPEPSGMEAAIAGQ